VLAGLAALRDLQKLSLRDGKSSDTDQGLVAYYRAHHNPCPAVPPVIAVAIQAQAAEAAAAETVALEEAKKALKAKAAKAREAAEQARKAKGDKAAQDAAEKLAKAEAGKPRPLQPPKLPTHVPPAPPPPSPKTRRKHKTKANRKKPPSAPDAAAATKPTVKYKPKVKYVTKPNIQRNNNQWYQMIGTEDEATCFYDNNKAAANLEALPVGEVTRNAVKYFKFNQPCSANQALAWAQLDDLSTGYTVDLNSYAPATHMIHISLMLLYPDNLPTDALE
jgi:hypothetical protein